MIARGKVLEIDCHDRTITIRYRAEDWVCQYTFPMFPGIHILKTPLSAGDLVELDFADDGSVTLRSPPRCRDPL